MWVLRRATENGQPRRGDVVRLSGCDPLNLAGIISPGDRVTATLGNHVVLRDGVPVAGGSKSPGDEEAGGGVKARRGAGLSRTSAAPLARPAPNVQRTLPPEPR